MCSTPAVHLSVHPYGQIVVKRPPYSIWIYIYIWACCDWRLSRATVLARGRITSPSRLVHLVSVHFITYHYTWKIKPICPIWAQLPIFSLSIWAQLPIITYQLPIMKQLCTYLIHHQFSSSRSPFFKAPNHPQQHLSPRHTFRTKLRRISSFACFKEGSWGAPERCTAENKLLAPAKAERQEASCSTTSWWYPHVGLNLWVDLTVYKHCKPNQQWFVASNPFPKKSSLIIIRNGNIRNPPQMVPGKNKQHISTTWRFLIENTSVFIGQWSGQGRRGHGNVDQCDLWKWCIPSGELT